MLDVVQQLTREILDHGKVRNSVLGKTNEWKNSHYESLSEIINEELFEKIDINSEVFFSLGNTISPITLKRIFKNQIKESAYKDARFLKSLEKLSIFLGYEELNIFIAQKVSSKENSEVDDLTVAISLIEKACASEYKQMLHLPDLDLDDFDGVVCNSSPYLKRIEMYLQKLSSYGKLKLQEELSNFEVYNYQLVSKNDDTIVIKTEETWNLIFSANEKFFPYQKKEEQVYFLRKNEDNNWLIWDNYNPDIDEILNS